MSARPYHKRYHSDALAGFMALDLEERGAYQTLLDMMYDRGGPLVDNERLLAGYMGCSVRKWRALRDSLIEKRKIHINRDREISNSRVEKELENDAKTTRKLAENGSKGGRTRSAHAEKHNENSETVEAPLNRGSSLSQKPEAIINKPSARGSPCPPDLRAVIDAAGMSTQPPDHQLLREWLALPDMELERDILPIVRRVAERGRQMDGRAPFRLKFFDAAIREQHAADEAEIARMRRGRRLIEEQDAVQAAERAATG